MRARSSGGHVKVLGERLGRDVVRGRPRGIIRYAVGKQVGVVVRRGAPQVVHEEGSLDTKLGVALTPSAQARDEFFVAR